MGEKIVGIEEVSRLSAEVEIINRSGKKYPHLRQLSKAPTFLLTYGGTYHGLINNCGLSIEQSKAIETNYHELYKKSDAYVANRLKQASEEGYVTVAFGLKLRTPLLKQVAWNTDSVPYEAQAEGRTAGNALGQSFGLLNNRATNAFMELVWESEFKYSILPIGQIHDCTYFLIKNDLKTLEWANKHLIKEMEWQELPEIQHPDVHLGAELDVCINGWHEPITLPNNASVNEIINLLKGTQ